MTLLACSCATTVDKPTEAAAQVQPQAGATHDDAAQKAKESVAELNATTYATLLVAAKDDTDSKQARWNFLNILDPVSSSKSVAYNSMISILVWPIPTVAAFDYSRRI